MAQCARVLRSLTGPFAQNPQVDQIICDTNAYQEGRPCVHVRTCDRESTTSSICKYGDWVEGRVLLWQDTDRALHVTTVTKVSKRRTNHTHRAPRPAILTDASRRRLQDGSQRVFSVATHHFARRDGWDLVVVKKGESTHAEVCSFAHCAALRNLFVRRLRLGARPGDDTGLTLLLCPCVADLRCMLSVPMPSLPPGLLVELAKAVQKEVGGALSLGGVTGLWDSLRAALRG